MMAEAVGMLKVLCARSMTAAVKTLAGDFSRETGCEVDLSFGTVGALQERLEGGETADVLILGAPAIAKMEQSGAIVAGSGAPIARTSIGVAIRERVPAPDISTPDSFRRTLLAAHVIALSDAAVGGSAGTYLVALWERMGIAEEIRRKAIPQKSGAEVARRVAEGKADLGLTLIGEIVTVEGVRVIGKLPPPFGNDTTYAAGISVSCDDGKAAAAFIAALASPATRQIWTKAGFEPAAGDMA
jgi:molybdate transport system substrate-binding protein